MPAPITAGDIVLTSNGGTVLALPITAGVQGLPRSWRASVLALSQGVGEVVQEESVPEAFDFTVTGQFNATSQSDLVSRKDALQAVLNDPPLKVQIYGASDPRYLIARPNNFNRLAKRNLLFGDMTLSFHVASPFLYTDPASAVDSAISSSPHDTVINNQGNAPAPVKVTVAFGASANMTNLIITNQTNGSVLNVSRAFGANDDLVFDGDRLTLVINTVNSLLQASDSTLNTPLYLSPGNNTLRLTTTSGTVDITTLTYDYQERWY